MFPRVTEIVLVEEGGALLRRDLSQADQSVILVKILVFWTRLTIVRAFVGARHTKLMEMGMRPAHRDLQNMVQLMQCKVPRHDNPSPDGWLNLCQADIQFVFVVRANRWHGLLLSYHTLPLQGVFPVGHP